MDIDYQKFFWNLWIASFGNKKYLDGLDAIRLGVIARILVTDTSVLRSLKFCLFFPILIIRNTLSCRLGKEHVDEIHETDILFVSHTERSDIWDSMTRLINVLHFKQPGLKLSALIPSTFNECPSFVLRNDLEKIENPCQKRSLEYKINALKSFARNCKALLVCPKDKSLKRSILNNLPEILFRLFSACFQIQLGRKFIKEIKPKIVVVSVDTSSPVSCSAVMENIPVFQIQHGIREVYYAIFVSDICFTWGKLSQEGLLNWGALPETLVEAGSLKVASVENKIKAGLANAEKNDVLISLIEKRVQGYRILVHFSQGLSTSSAFGQEGEKYDLAVSWILDAYAKLNKKYLLVIKLHPVEKDNSAYLKKWGKDSFADVVFVNGTVPIFDLLSIADIATVVKSTSGLDTMLAGVPLIQLFHDAWEDITMWQKHGLHRCSSSEHLYSVLHDLHSPYRRQQALKIQKKILQLELSNRGKEPEFIATEILKRLEC